jgi:hypothetical protein
MGAAQASRELETSGNSRNRRNRRRRRSYEMTVVSVVSKLLLLPEPFHSSKPPLHSTGTGSKGRFS